jgi:hypothetical protein
MSVCQMPVCKHAVPVKFGCMACDEEKQTVYDNFAKESFDVRLDILFKHVSRLDNLFDPINNAQSIFKNSLDDLWEDHARKVSDIEAVCEVIEKIQEKVTNLESFIDELKTTWKNDVEEYQKWYENVEHRIDLISNQQTRAYQSRKPYQCPNCRGCGRNYEDVLSLLSYGECPPETQLDHEGRRYKICISCEGKGIVWG